MGARMWNMDFWKRQCGEDRCLCRARSPAFEDDGGGADAFVVDASVAEYVDYVRLVQRADRKCLEENALAYMRVTLDGWTPFACGMRDTFGDTWQQLGPPGLKDFTARWTGFFARTCDLDWLEHYACFYQISIGATGAITRLHEESAG